MTHVTDIPPSDRRQIGWKSLFSSVKIREGHDNFFTPLRLLMASLVMVGHAFVIAMKSMSAEPSVFLDYNFSYLAVNVFFITSGFLVTKSMVYRNNMPDYCAARALRIYPALIVHLLFVILVIGAISTTLPLKEYFTHSDGTL